ncbi:MAG: chromosome partitioning protein ParB [Blastochloris sp.]|nr:chromosome partitioning protein ParB [Blastochloris sp.]
MTVRKPPPDFTLAGAQRAAAAGALPSWVHAYLLSGPWANPGLAYGLRHHPRWWCGPRLVPITQLARCCGPEPELEYPMAVATWEQRVGQIVAGLAAPEALPPLIAEYRAGMRSVRDGNHRLAALARAGYRAAWVIIWYNTAADAATDTGQAPC